MTFYDHALVVDGEKYNACGACAEACPVRAVTVAGMAQVDQARCIHCYCCMELCTRQAVSVVRRRRSETAGAAGEVPPVVRTRG